MQTVNDDESVRVAFAAESMAGVRALGAAVLGATNAGFDDPGAAEDTGADDGAPEDIEPGAAEEDIEPEAAGAAAELEVLDELAAGVELEPQALSTSPLTVITAKSAAWVLRI